MRLFDLGVLYLVVGGGCLAVLWFRNTASFGPVNGVLMLFLWPVYAPYELAGTDLQPRNVTVGPDGEFLDAMRRIEGTPLAGLLPDRATARTMAARLSAAQNRVDEIDRTLQGNDFDEEAAKARLEELLPKGDDVSIAAARRRLQNIERLRLLRADSIRRLEQVGELLLQLKTQAEVLRLAGQVDDGIRELFEELMRRLDGMDEAMQDTVPSSA